MLCCVQWVLGLVTVWSLMLLVAVWIGAHCLGSCQSVGAYKRTSILSNDIVGSMALHVTQALCEQRKPQQGPASSSQYT